MNYIIILEIFMNLKVIKFIIIIFTYIHIYILFKLIQEIEGIFAINSRKILKAKLLKELSAIKTEKSTLFGREVIFIYYETSCIPIKIKFIFNPEELKFNGDCSIPLTVYSKTTLKTIKDT